MVRFITKREKLAILEEAKFQIEHRSIGLLDALRRGIAECLENANYIEIKDVFPGFLSYRSWYVSESEYWLTYNFIGTWMRLRILRKMKKAVNS